MIDATALLARAAQHDACAALDKAIDDIARVSDRFDGAYANILKLACSRVRLVSDLHKRQPEKIPMPKDRLSCISG